MRTFSCDEARSCLPDVLAGVIGLPEANVLEAHLLGCDPCRDLSELFLWQDRVIAELAGRARLDTLMSRVRAALQNLDQVTTLEEERSRRSWSFSPKWASVAAAFALAFLAVLFWKPPSPGPSIAVAPAPPKTQAAPVPAPEPVEQAPQPPEDHPSAPPIETPSQPTTPAVVEATRPPVTAPKNPEVAVKEKPAPAPPKPPDPAVVKSAGGEVVLKPRTLDDAVRDGMAYLKEKAAEFGRESKADELLLWTWLQGGMAESAPEFQALLKSALGKKLERTYNVALTAMALEGLDRVKHQKRIAQCAQFLLDNQCANGQWAYGDPSIFAEDLHVPPAPPKFKGVRKVTVTRRREGPASGDNSNSMYAMLGLRACHDAGIVLPRGSVDHAARWWRESQSRSVAVKGTAVAEGWCYNRHDHKPYGSMTAGGVGSLVICDYILNIDWKKDPHVAAGMEWMAKNFSVTFHPGPHEHADMAENSQHQYHYYMYALERAGIFVGTDRIGKHWWYEEGALELLRRQQDDGSWSKRLKPQDPNNNKGMGPPGDPVADTCFAILFLRRATRPFDDVASEDKKKK
jgi:hypothetical protein